MTLNAPEPDRAVSRLRAARSGLIGVAPTMAMICPFGVLSGAISAEAGLDLAQTFALSALVFAGASQLATIELLRAGAPVLVILAAGLAVNLRFTMYAASLAPWLRGARPWPKAASAFLLVDNLYGVALGWWRRTQSADLRARLAYYFAAGLATWIAWQATTLIGYRLGAALPEAWRLEAAAPIAFLALAFPLLDGKPAWIAAAVAAALATALSALPYGAGLLIASVAGIAAALLAERLGALRREPADG